MTKKPGKHKWMVSILKIGKTMLIKAFYRKQVFMLLFLASQGAPSTIATTTEPAVDSVPRQKLSNDTTTPTSSINLVTETAEMIELINQILEQNTTADPANKQLVHEQVVVFKRALNSLRSEELAAALNFMLYTAEYFGFLALVMLSNTNTDNIPATFRSPLPRQFPLENSTTSSSLSNKIDLAQLEELIEKLEEDIEYRLNSLDHPEKGNIRKILKARKKLLNEQCNHLRISLHEPHRSLFETVSITNVGVCFSLLGITTLALLASYDKDDGFKHPSLKTIEKNMHYIVTNYIK